MGFISTIKSWVAPRGVRAAGGMGLFGQMSGSGSVRHEEAWLRAAGKNSHLLTPVHCIASDVAVVNWHVEEQVSKDQKFERGPLSESGDLLKELWEKPHPRLPRYHLLYWTQSCLELVGRCAWRLMEFDDKGRPGELWPLPPHWIKQTPTSNNGHFKIAWWGEEGDIDVPAAEITYFSRPGITDPMCSSQGIAQGVDDEVNQDEAMAKFNNFYFQNFAMLGLLIGVPGFDEAAPEIEAKFKEKRTGAHNAFKTMIVDSRHGNVTATNLAPKLSDLNFQEGRKQSRDFIREAWQVPPERAGVLDNSNRSTIDGADYFQQSKNTKPRLVTWQQELELKLVPLFDDRNKALNSGKRKAPRLRLVFEDPVTETEEMKLKVTREGFRAGWMTVNEARRRHDLETVSGGDVFLVPVNNVRAVSLDGQFVMMADPNPKEVA